MAATLIRLAYPHQAVRRVFRGPLRGCRFVVVPGMGFTYAAGTDHWQFRFLQERLRPGMTVYDAGANCGQMSLFFSQQVKPSGHVISFEPAPENAATLRRTLALNDCGHVEVIEAAVSDTEGVAQLRFDAEQHTMASLEGLPARPRSGGRVLEVQTVTLDGIVASGRPPPDVLKIDVEGAGLGVIRGALQLIETHRPRIFMEVHASVDDSPELVALRLLRDRFGYRLETLSGAEIRELKPVWGEIVWCIPPA